MLRRVVPALVAVVSLLGCSRLAPPTTENAALRKPLPKLELVSYLEEDKQVHGFLCRPSGEGPFPAVVMIHDRLGLTDGIKDQTFYLARAGYIVLAVDLYRGQHPKTTKEAERLERELTRERALHDLKAAVDYLTQRPDVRPKSPVAAARDQESWDLGVIGLGMGGSYALDAALHDPRLRALVLCYCPLPTEAQQLKPLKASVFCILAGQDKRVPEENITKFCKAMEEANKTVAGIRVYGDCQAGFLDPATWTAPEKATENQEKDKKKAEGKDEKEGVVKTTRSKESDKPGQGDIEDAWKVIAEFLNKVLM